MKKHVPEELGLEHVGNEDQVVAFFVGNSPCEQKIPLCNRMARNNKDEYKGKIRNIFERVINHPNSRCCKNKLRRTMEKWIRENPLAEAA